MTLESEVKSLQAIPMFKGVEAARLKLLAFASERLRYDAGEEIFHQGDTSDAAYVILNGTVDVLLDTPSGRIHIARLPRGAIVGEMGILCDRTRTATIVAVDVVDTLKIGRSLFFDMMEEFPQMSIAVMRDLANRLERTNEQLASRFAPA